MSVRSFTVFQDTTTEIQEIKNNSDRDVTTTTTDSAATLLSTLAAIEKENLHPVTGERAASSSSNAPKKRKSAVLVTKVLAPLPSSKKQKDVKSDSRKLRKSSNGNGKKADGRKKSARGTRSTRKASPLPRVDEEQEALTATPTPRYPTRLTISQSNIDSRCYELTVSPLADVSEAYDTATETSDQESVFDKVRISFLLFFDSVDTGFRSSLPNPKSVTTFLLHYRTRHYHPSKLKLLLLLQRQLVTSTSPRQNANRSTQHLPFHLPRLHRNVLRKLNAQRARPTSPPRNNSSWISLRELSCHMYILLLSHPTHSHLHLHLHHQTQMVTCLLSCS